MWWRAAAEFAAEIAQQRPVVREPELGSGRGERQALWHHRAVDGEAHATSRQRALCQRRFERRYQPRVGYRLVGPRAAPVQAEGGVGLDGNARVETRTDLAANFGCGARIIPQGKAPTDLICLAVTRRRKTL